MQSDDITAYRRFQKLKPWSEYPIGTKALSINGGYWIKINSGWKWHCGDTFPTPGACAFDVELPTEQCGIESGQL